VTNDVLWHLAPVAALAGLLLGLLALTVTLIRRGRVPNGPADPAIGHSPYAACHSAVCGHMSTPHVRTPDGALTCRECGTARPEAPRA
jgi:hypothetical protein